jgi:hypothetical protein
MMTREENAEIGSMLLATYRQAARKPEANGADNALLMRETFSSLHAHGDENDIKSDFVDIVSDVWLHLLEQDAEVDTSFIQADPEMASQVRHGIPTFDDDVMAARAMMEDIRHLASRGGEFEWAAVAHSVQFHLEHEMQEELQDEPETVASPSP